MKAPEHCRCAACQRLGHRFPDDGRQLALPLGDAGVSYALLERLRDRRAARLDAQEAHA